MLLDKEEIEILNFQLTITISIENMLEKKKGKQQNRWWFKT